MKKWSVADINKKNASRISKQYSIPILPSILLDSKKFKNDTEMLEFVSDSAEFTDPFLISDMDIAVERINRAVDNFEKICIYGDYDADGVTSTAVLFSYLESISAYVMYYIPERESDGYGLNKDAVQLLSDDGVKLIITVDNGISAYEEIEYANELGVDVIVTDHHTPPERLPNSVANVNPHRADDNSPFKDFSGVGVVFKLIMALESDNLTVEDLLDLYSDICAVGTVGDVVSLTGENRLLVKEGLKRLNDNIRPGLEILRNKVGYENKELTSTAVAFAIVPKINACGRLGGAQKAVRLFLTEDYEEAEALADELIEENNIRKSIEQEILTQVIKVIDSDDNIRLRKVLVVEGENWHQGVIGIVAARIKEMYGKPTMIISYSGESAKGSGRSIEGFSMCDAVTYCKELLTIFGGHPMAAGWSLPTDNIAAFRDKVNEYADMTGSEFFPQIDIVCKLNPTTVNTDIVKGLSFLEPYGTDNPGPVFGFYGFTLKNIIPLSGGKHLKLQVSRENSTVSVLFFGCSENDFPYAVGDVLNLAVTLDINTFNNKTELAVYGKDICFADVDYEELLKSKQVYEDYVLGKPVTDSMKKELSVTRDDFVIVYKFLRNSGGFAFAPDLLYYRIKNDNISFGKLMLILEAMKQMNLIIMNPTAYKLNVEMVNKPPKVDILSAAVLKRLF